MTSAVLDVRDLTKHYGDVVAVDGVSFRVGAGEIFGFLGPNGAGKTTTINALTGLVDPTGGEISVLGLAYPGHISEAQGHIGVVPDESNLYGEMDGFGNLCFCAALYGLPRRVREPRARELLDRFDLAEVGRRPFAAYSRGMKRKLTIAAALIHRPQILFLDEPTTGIDVASARQIRRLLGDLNADGVTIFLTTHYIEEAERLCHRIAFIVAGRIVRIDTKESLLAEADGSSSLLLALDGNLEEGARLLGESFPDIAIARNPEGNLLLTAADELELLPLLQRLHEGGVKVYEARIARPSLEDVFVRVTGIEAREMKAAEGRGRG